ncbi:MAG: hypothetical protein GMKNLPBB_02473 [Myxococcota bacterium]|nr:hypothetical protein [Myxococcota bacterium]
MEGIHMRTLSRWLLAAAFIALFSAAGCDCEETFTALKSEVEVVARDGDKTIDPSAQPVDFGDVPVQSAKKIDIAIRSKGTFTLKVESIKLTGESSPEFALEGVTGTIRVEPSREFVFKAVFAPKDKGKESASIEILTDNETAKRIIVPLEGNGVEAIVTSRDIDFGEVPVGTNATESSTINNDGNIPLVIEKAAFTENPTDDGIGAFDLIKGAEPGTSIPPGGKFDITVLFSPNARKAYTGKLEIRARDSARPPITVNLRGKGVAPVIQAQPQLLDFGTGVSSGERVFTITNVGDPGQDLVIEEDGDPGTPAPIRFAENTAKEFTLTLPAGLTSAASALKLKAGDPSSKAEVAVKYTPSQATSALGRVIVMSNDPLAPRDGVEIQLRAAAPAPSIQVFPANASFDSDGKTTEDKTTFSICNVGTADLGVLDIQIKQAGSEFTFNNIPAKGTIVKPDPGAALDCSDAKNAVTFEVVYAPKTNGTHTAAFVVVSNDPQKTCDDSNKPRFQQDCVRTLTGVSKGK